jgi:hypothetical protein
LAVLEAALLADRRLVLIEIARTAASATSACAVNYPSIHQFRLALPLIWLS